MSRKIKKELLISYICGISLLISACDSSIRDEIANTASDPDIPLATIS